MSKQGSLFLFFLFFKFICIAQDIPVKVVPTEIFRSVKKDPNDTLSWNWKRGGIINLNIAQGSLSNWAAGGDKFSLAVTSYVNYFLLMKRTKHTWDNSLDFNFGFINTSSLGSRKNDDRFEILSKYGRRLDSSNKIYLSGLFDFRTQFFDGYTYNDQDSGILSSTFFSPAYLLLSVGFDYKPKDYFSFFISPLTQRTTIVASDRLSKQGVYGVPPYGHFYNQIGAFASINFYKSIFKNVLYKGKMDLFTDYQHNPQNVDMYFTNLFNFKINRFLSATYSLDMIYDDDVKLFGKYNNSPALQVKSLIGIGFSMPLSTTITK
ncbi:MAG TPA: DUF3078 domain-containing protein [Chitinophagaceae bacterium]|jgi:hypothetical protein